MRKDILVIDDSPLILSMLGDMLELLGFRATRASSGQQGCELLAAGPFDLVITDLNMPGMDGVEFARRARQLENGRSVPIMMLSGDGDQSRIDEARASGVSVFLAKPFRGSELKASLSSLFG